MLRIGALLRFVGVCVICQSVSSARYLLHKSKGTASVSSWRISAGYDPGAHCKSVEDTAATIAKKSAFVCNGLTAQLLNATMTHKGESAFRVDKFLSLLRGKSIGIIGDSIALQMYQDLRASLVCEESYSHEGNGVVTTYKYNAYKWPGPNHDVGGIRRYGKYNASMYFCYDPLMELQKHQFRYEFCGVPCLRSDIIVFGIGHWFKPWLNNGLYRQYNNYSDLIAKTSESNIASLTTAMNYALNQSKLHNPKAHIIWRLIPHLGNIDEVNFDSRGKDPISMMHHNGSFWRDVAAEPAWAKLYNQVIISFAQQHNHSVLDWYTASHLAIEYYKSIGLSTHIDSQHYCSGGFPYLANALLQNALIKLLHQSPPDTPPT
jgi:hypothetical protein